MSASSLDHIRQPVEEEYQYFQRYFKEVMKSRMTLLNWVLRYILKTKGKQMRPLLVLLSAKANGPVTQKSYTAAALMEILHTATLVHDDVVDKAEKRRGYFTINALWKNKAAVLVGDYLLSRGMLLALENKYYTVLEILSRAVKAMSEGEILQMQKSRSPSLTEEEYYDIIRGKTASLFAAACATGCASSTSDPERIQQMEAFGMELGIAFQIKDDLLDIEGNNTGKTRGADLLDRKITLPVIHALSTSSGWEKKKMQRLIAQKKKSKAQLQQLFDWIKDKGGIAYARAQMQLYIHQARNKILDLEASESQRALIDLCHFVAERTK